MAWLAGEFELFGTIPYLSSNDVKFNFKFTSENQNMISSVTTNRAISLKRTLHSTAWNVHVHTNALLFQVAIKLAPDRKKFMEIISGSGNINADIEKFCSTFSPLLAENHKFLVSSVQTIVLLGWPTQHFLKVTILWCTCVLTGQCGHGRS